MRFFTVCLSKTSPNWKILVTLKAQSCDDSMLMLYFNVSATALTRSITPITGAKGPCTSGIGATFVPVLLAKILAQYIYITVPSSATIPVNYVIMITG